MGGKTISTLLRKYPPTPTPNKEKLLQRTGMGVIDLEAVEKMFQGQPQGDEQTVKKEGHADSLCLLMVKMRRPSCSQYWLFEATCCLMCSCWSPFNTEQRIIYFDLGFGDSGPYWHSREGFIVTIIMRHTFNLEEIILRINGLGLKKQPSKSETIEFFILTAAVHFFFFWSKPKFFSRH